MSRSTKSDLVIHLHNCAEFPDTERIARETVKALERQQSRIDDALATARQNLRALVMNRATHTEECRELISLIRQVIAIHSPCATFGQSSKRGKDTRKRTRATRKHTV